MSTKTQLFESILRDGMDFSIMATEIAEQLIEDGCEPRMLWQQVYKTFRDKGVPLKKSELEDIKDAVDDVLNDVVGPSEYALDYDKMNETVLFKNVMNEARSQDDEDFMRNNSPSKLGVEGNKRWDKLYWADHDDPDRTDDEIESNMVWDIRDAIISFRKDAASIQPSFWRRPYVKELMQKYNMAKSIMRDKSNPEEIKRHGIVALKIQNRMLKASIEKLSKPAPDGLSWAPGQIESRQQAIERNEKLLAELGA